MSRCSVSLRRTPHLLCTKCQHIPRSSRLISTESPKSRQACAIDSSVSLLPTFDVFPLLEPPIETSHPFPCNSPTQTLASSPAPPCLSACHAPPRASPNRCPNARPHLRPWPRPPKSPCLYVPSLLSLARTLLPAPSHPPTGLYKPLRQTSTTPPCPSSPSTLSYPPLTSPGAILTHRQLTPAEYERISDEDMDTMHENLEELCEEHMLGGEVEYSVCPTSPSSPSSPNIAHAHASPAS
jgi:hypothetical protein